MGKKKHKFTILIGRIFLISLSIIFFNPSHKHKGMNNVFASEPEINLKNTPKEDINTFVSLNELIERNKKIEETINSIYDNFTKSLDKIEELHNSKQFPKNILIFQNKPELKPIYLDKFLKIDELKNTLKEKTQELLDLKKKTSNIETSFNEVLNDTQTDRDKNISELLQNLKKISTTNKNTPTNNDNLNINYNLNKNYDLNKKYLFNERNQIKKIKNK